MKYFFILGRVPELSLIEIFSVLESEGISRENFFYSPDVLVLETTAPIDSLALQRRLGGTIKIGKIIDTLPLSRDPLSYASALSTHLETLCPDTGRRCTFGLSAYTVTYEKKNEHQERFSSSRLRALTLEIKKNLKNSGRSVRGVLPERGTALSSVGVTRNKLASEQGAELVLLPTARELFVGKTHSVQDYESYSSRDWGRPNRDMKTGLLPPKLAQIMINLTKLSPKNNPALLDPFCGMGTLVQEALLMGFRAVRGSDIDASHIEQAKKNISWATLNNFPEKKSGEFSAAALFMQADARALSRTITPQSIDAIVTEPTLGPALRGTATALQIASMQKQLAPLYQDFFRECGMLVRPSGMLVLVLPVWIVRGAPVFFPLDSLLSGTPFENITIPPEMRAHYGAVTARSSLLIAREHQRVARELFVFCRNTA